MVFNFILSAMVALSICLYAGHLLQPVAKHLGLIDEPGGRKKHKQVTPLIGGIAMFLGFAFALLTLPISLAPYRSLIAGSCLLMIVGVLDDLHEVPAYSRLVGQGLASFFMVFWGSNTYTQLGDLLGTGNISLNLLSIPFSIFIALSTINAMNMLDGLDGLLGALSLIIGSSLLLVTYNLHIYDSSYITIIFIAVLLGYLFYNFPKNSKAHAKIFMGDSGSMFIGFIIIWLIIHICSKNKFHTFNTSIVFWIMAVPIFDIINVSLRRIFLGKNPLHATRDHIHHFFLLQGLSTFKTLWLIIFICIVSNMIGLTLFYMKTPAYYSFYLYSSLFLLSTIIYQYQWKKVNKEVLHAY